MLSFWGITCPRNYLNYRRIPHIMRIRQSSSYYHIIIVTYFHVRQFSAAFRTLQHDLNLDVYLLAYF